MADYVWPVPLTTNEDSTVHSHDKAFVMICLILGVCSFAFQPDTVQYTH